MSIERILPFTLKWEGGSAYTNDPLDPGGETRFGISKRAHPDLDIFNLTEDQARDIYKTEYWDKVAEGIDDDLDCVCFDTAVNVGVSRVKKWLPLCKGYQDMFYQRRLHYFKIINANPKLAKYQAGWENRCKALEEFIKEA